MNIYILKGALCRKKSPQIVLRSDNPSGFRLVNAKKAKDEDFYNVQFLGVFTGKTHITTLEREVGY